MEPLKAIQYAAAASCLKHSIELDVNLSTVAEITTLMNGDGSGRVTTLERSVTQNSVTTLTKRTLTYVTSGVNSGPSALNAARKSALVIATPSSRM